jgi:hypothetical protein
VTKAGTNGIYAMNPTVNESNRQLNSFQWIAKVIMLIDRFYFMQHKNHKQTNINKQIPNHDYNSLKSKQQKLLVQQQA